jgi:hypothetical protein
MKCIKPSYIRIVKVDHNRQLFTKHGLHLSGIGKESFSRQCVSLICSILMANADPPIVTNLHKEYDTDCLPTQSVSSNEMIPINQLSARIKKIL